MINLALETEGSEARESVEVAIPAPSPVATAADGDSVGEAMGCGSVARDCGALECRGREGGSSVPITSAAAVSPEVKA